MRTPTIADLRHRLLLEQPLATPDGAGGANVTWSTVTEVWAAVVPLTADEVAEADGRAGTVRYRIVVRTGPAITPAQRFRLGARSFPIRGVRPLGSPVTHLVCDCDERDL
jgi:SPP1 family predicted phage head-tail adaptor